MAPFISVRNVTKRYRSVTALLEVDLDVTPGEVHAIVGENGAGKSTLMGVLTGFVQPDTGEGTVLGRPLPFGKPVELKEAGIELVHQHFMLVNNFRVDENLALAEAARTRSTYNPRETVAKALSIANRLGWDLDFRQTVAHLPVGIQQRVEILKALLGDPQVLVLDEPTAVLAPDEIENLLDMLRKLARSGVGVVLIAHKLDEVMAVADRVTVLRQGRVVGSSLAAETDINRVATLMVGEVVPSIPRSVAVPGPTALRVSNLNVLGDRGEPAIKDVSFEVNCGEILGIGGVDGNGQVELAEAVAGVRRISAGQIEWLLEEPRIGFVPQDRQANGLAITLTVLENLAIGCLDDRSMTMGPFMQWRRIEDKATDLVASYEVKVPSVYSLVSSLSGGNQQKIVVARAMSQQPNALVVVNPTRGLDIRATSFVHAQILRATASGTAVLLVSTDLDELNALANRTVFLKAGRFTDSLAGAAS